MKTTILFCIIAVIAASLLAGCTQQATPTATPTPIATASIVPTATPTATPSPTTAPTATPTVIVTPTPTATPTATPNVTPTASPTATATPTSTPTPTPTPAPAFKKGVSLSPKSFTAADFPTDFFTKAAQAGTIVSWAGDWGELAAPNGGPTVVAELSKQYNYTPLVEAQFFTQSTGELLRPLDAATKQAYLDAAAAFAAKYKPAYLGFGIEVNTLWEKNVSAFDDFANFYAQVYAAVKAASPATKVFTIFQLEKMKGLNGGLFGGTNNASNNEWALLYRFASDITAFTTYPGLVLHDPSEIPADYYSEIAAHTEKPVAFTEIGWHSSGALDAWPGSEAKQANFVSKFFNLTSGLNREFAVWSFLYDQNTTQPFNSMGFFGADGSQKTAWAAWLNAK